MPSACGITHNAAAHRYETVVDGHLAVCEYTDTGDRRVFTHTRVPPELRGRGLAEELVRAALADTGATGRKIVPVCSYVVRFIERHKEYADLVE